MSVLDKILSAKRLEVERCKAGWPIAEVRALARDSAPTRGFLAQLQRKATPLSLVAEFKRGSPSSGGTLRHIDVAKVASVYERSGAACMSVLTDWPFFGGCIEDLKVANGACSLPILRKDFVIDAYQVVESRVIGADAILLIVAALSKDQLKLLYEEATSIGLDTLVEVHSEMELELALSLDCPLIGVNNRDLTTLEIDLATSERLIPLIGAAAFPISESGLDHRNDVVRVENAGANGVLIGTALCDAPDPEAKVREVMGW